MLEPKRRRLDPRRGSVNTRARIGHNRQQYDESFEVNKVNRMRYGARRVARVLCTIVFRVDAGMAWLIEQASFDSVIVVIRFLVLFVHDEKVKKKTKERHVSQM